MIPFLAVASLPSVVSVLSVVVLFLTRTRERLALFNSPPRGCCETLSGYGWVSRLYPGCAAQPWAKSCNAFGVRVVDAHVEGAG